MIDNKSPSLPASELLEQSTDCLTKLRSLGVQVQNNQEDLDAESAKRLRLVWQEMQRGAEKVAIALSLRERVGSVVQPEVALEIPTQEEVKEYIDRGRNSAKVEAYAAANKTFAQKLFSGISKKNGSLEALSFQTLFQKGHEAPVEIEVNLDSWFTGLEQELRVGEKHTVELELRNNRLHGRGTFGLVLTIIEDRTEDGSPFSIDVQGGTLETNPDIMGCHKLIVPVSKLAEKSNYLVNLNITAPDGSSRELKLQFVCERKLSVE